MPSVGEQPGQLVVILGPTAVGKTALSLELAEQFDGEIVSADSRQIYRGMDIGAAKPTAEEQARVPHHLLDLVAPDETLSLAQYQQAAYTAIDDILRRGRLPLLVGGTGQYASAVIEGWNIPEVPPNPALRESLEREAAEHGAQALHDRLRQVDPAAAARIDPRNVRRVIRALEVYLESGQPISALQRKTPPPYRVLQIVLTRPRADLYARIDARLDAMMRCGLLQEVRGLLEAGYSPTLPAMSGLGYAQLCHYLLGETTLDEALATIRRDTRTFARHQETWFRKYNRAALRFEMTETTSATIIQAVCEWLESEIHGTSKTCTRFV